MDVSMGFLLCSGRGRFIQGQGRCLPQRALGEKELLERRENLGRMGVPFTWVWRNGIFCDILYPTMEFGGVNG